jgi:hypothetical protein
MPEATDQASDGGHARRLVVCCAKEGENMNTPLTVCPDRRHYELRFPSLFDTGRAYAFDCDAAGQVDMDALSARARLNYLYARTAVGRDLAPPEVCRRARH